MMDNVTAARTNYLRQTVASATPERLLTLLFDRLLLDLARAARAHEGADWPAYSAELLHAQDILTELSTTLRPDVWDGAASLAALYQWAGDQLVLANIRRDATALGVAAAVLEPLAQTWHEAADLAAGSTGAVAGVA